MRVLYVSHTAARSGAEVSLLELIEGLPGDVSPLVACPEGELAAALRARGVGVSRMPAIDASFRFHPLHTPRGLGQIAAAAVAVRRAARRHRADVVHANSVRAGLAAAVAGGAPVLVHVRDCLPAGAASNVIRRLVAARAARVLANSRYTAEAFRREGHARVEVVHSPVDLGRFDPARVDRAQERARLGLDGRPALAVIGQITPWKGHDTALRALALVKRTLDARLLIVGSVKFAGEATRYDNDAYLRSLRSLAAELGVAADVSFLGERSDVPEIMRAVDLVLVPSWEEPFGRVVVEAMAMETPVLATSAGGPGEVVEDGVNGRLAAPRDPAGWARAVQELLAAEDRRGAMGRAGRATAERFDRARHVERVLAAYREVLAGAPAGPV